MKGLLIITSLFGSSASITETNIYLKHMGKLQIFFSLKIGIPLATRKSFCEISLKITWNKWNQDFSSSLRDSFPMLLLRKNGIPLLHKRLVFRKMFTFKNLNGFSKKHMWKNSLWVTLLAYVATSQMFSWEFCELF